MCADAFYRRAPRLFRRLSERVYIDVGPPDATTFIAGMGRSGTTWVGAVVNHDFSYRILFEPFLPHDVPAASVFGPYAYVPPSDADPGRRRAAETILSGRTPRGTVDRDHRGRVFRKRIIKEVRCNLMLGFLKTLRPAMPMVFLVRNPFAVTASWLRLQWGTVAHESRLELDVILEHDELLAHFPAVRSALGAIDRSDAFERTIFQWGLVHLVPLRHLVSGQALLVRYEDLVRTPRPVVAQLAGYLQVPMEGPSLERALERTAATDFLHRGPHVSHDDVLTDWQRVLTPRQIVRGHEILELLGVDDLYDAEGMPTPALALSGRAP